jgi:23S rRNA (uracil1939-C5)-methyltransferase
MSASDKAGGKTTLLVEKLGRRGEGVARHGTTSVFIPFALPGESLRAQIIGDRAEAIETLQESPLRVPPPCAHYGVCGGCAVGALREDAYRDWKRGLVESALANAKLEMPVGALIDAQGEGRRRATFHARFGKGKARVGFMQARSHDLVEIDACPLLAPGLDGALAAARALAQRLAGLGKPLDITVAATPQGLDIDVKGCGDLPDALLAALTKSAERLDLARLSNHGRLIVLRRKPLLRVGAAEIAPPAGGFLQATQAGEEALAGLVREAAQGAIRIADLFCGHGAFALQLAQRAQIYACDTDAAAIDALQSAARGLQGHKRIDAEARDLFTRPLAPAELNAFHAVVVDPPRAGAEAQARALAESTVARIISVSCNPQSFARDAAILIAGGYAPAETVPLDQFRFAPHVEIFAVFQRPQATKRKRPLLSR